MEIQKIKKLWQELSIGLHYKVMNRKDEMGVGVKVLMLVSHGIAKRDDEEFQSIYVNTGIFTYFPKEKEREELMLELIDDHKKEAQTLGWEIRYNIPLEERHRTAKKYF